MRTIKNLKFEVVISFMYIEIKKLKIIFLSVVSYN
jgi:hypothetical protein